MIPRSGGGSQISSGGGVVTYATWNPADKGVEVTLSNGDLTASITGATLGVLVRATISKSTGKWYWEVTIGACVTFSPIAGGIAKSTAALTTYLGGDANGWGYYGSNGKKINNATQAAYGLTYVQNDIIGVALDCDGGTVECFKNGASQGVMYSGLSGTFFGAASGAGGGSQIITANFGASTFTYTPPAGFNSGLYQ